VTGIPVPSAPGGSGAPMRWGDRARELLRTIAEIPAPPFDEGDRAAFVAARWRTLGLEARIDGVGNVVADVPGGTGPRVVLAAHLDTVFEAGTDVTIRERPDGTWAAPGIGDNSASLAVLTALAEAMAAGGVRRRPRLTLAATVGEEGLGDLRGAKALVADIGERVDAFVAVDGHLGTIVDAGVGSRRFEAVFSGPGGHSWGDRGAPSAIHAACDAVHAVTRASVPRRPRSSLGVGLISGGTAVNAIAAEARFTVDIRSVDEATLAALEAAATDRVRSVARRHGVEVGIRAVGSRPAAAGGNEALVPAARAALGAAGIEAATSASSTDATAAMAAGVSAICLGVYRGGDAHRASEWMDPRSLDDGLQVLQALLGELARDDA
jgi:tripeptide aminopeptidase